MKHILWIELLTSFQFATLAERTRRCVAILTICSLTSAAYAATSEQLTEVRNHITRGNMLLGRRQFQDAIGEYENALRVDPSNQIAKDNIALTHNNWGIYFFGAHKYNEAKNQWEQALKLNPNDGHARRNLKILEQRMRMQAPVEQDGPVDEGGGPEKPKVKPDSTAGSAANTNNGDAAASGSAPRVVTTPGQQEAKLDTTSIIQNPESGATLIINSSTNYGQAAETSPVQENSTIRIIGGSSGTASIVGTGSSLSSNSAVQAAPVTPTVPTATFNIVAPNIGSGAANYGGGTTGSANTSGGVSTTGSTPTYPPVNQPTSTPYNASPSTAQSVPLSWPGAETSTPAQPVTKATPLETPPSFTRNRSKTSQHNSQDEESQQQPEQDGDTSGSSNATFENKVAQIETTVYGKATKNVPILRRIEKLEIDTFGKKKSGAIADRIKDLKEAYGI